MEPRTVLKRFHGRADFVYEASLPSCRANSKDRADLDVRPCSNGRALGYRGDSLAPCHFQFAPVPSLASFPINAMRRRANASRCAKVQVGKETWANGKQHGTKSRTAFLTNWKRCRPWRNIARISHVSWDAVRRAVGVPVAWHGADAGQEGVGTLGVDETALRSGYRGGSEVHWYAGQGDRPWEGWSAVAGEGRMAGSGLGLDERHACGGSVSARQTAYRNAVSRRAGQALRGAGAGASPRAWQLGETVGRVRAGGVRKRQDQKPRLGHTRCRWRRAEKLTNKWQLKSADLLNLNFPTMRMDWLNEDFQPVRNGGSLRQAARFRRCQCRLTIYSWLAPTQRVTHALRKHRPFRLNGCRCGSVRAVVRGVDRQGETGSRKSVQVQILRIPHNRLGSSLGRPTGTQICPHVLLKIEFYRQKPNKESAS